MSRIDVLALTYDGPRQVPLLQKISGKSSQRITHIITVDSTTPPISPHTYRHHVPYRNCSQRASRRHAGCSPSSTNVRRPKQPFQQHIPHHHPSDKTVRCSMLRCIIWSRSRGGYWQDSGSLEELRQGTMSSEMGSTRGIGLTWMVQYRSRMHRSSAHRHTSQTILVWIAWIPLRWLWR